MENLNILKRLHDERTRGCVAYGIAEGQYYFSINGLAGSLPNNHTILSFIKRFLGGAKFVGASYANSYFYPNVYLTPYPKILNNFYYYLSNFKKASIYFENLIKPNPYSSGTYPAVFNRYWTCAEKKLFGFSKKFTNIYITSRPCYYCLPAINCTCFFLHNNILHKLIPVDNKNPRHFIGL